MPPGQRKVESLRLRPVDPYAFDSRGLAYLRLGRIDDAVRDFNAALKIESKLVSSLYGRGLAKLGRGDAQGGNADVAAAKAIRSAIADELARYGIR